MAEIFHQTLFILIALVGIAELSLTAFLVAQGGEFPSRKYHDLLLYFLVNASWSIFFSVAYAYWIISQSTHFLASVATSVWWLFITSASWAPQGVAAGMFHTTRPGGICDGLPPISRCRQSLTVEALGWTEFALCMFTVLATWHWVVHENKGSIRGSWYSEQAREAA